MKRRKILHVVEAFGGGVFTFLADLTREMGEDFDVVIVYAERAQTPKQLKRIFPENVKFIKSRHLTRMINPLADTKAIGEIHSIIKKEQPDVVHLHSSKAGVIGRLASIGSGAKILYNPHGFSFLIKDASILKRAFYFGVEKIMAALPGTIVACSPGEYAEAQKLTRRVINIDNGLNLATTEAELKPDLKHKPDMRKLKVCTIGRINYQKNPELFNLIALANPEMKFTWIGDGNLRKKLNAPNIRITGWKSHAAAIKELQKADVFILTSLWEGLPIALLEAMYLKKLCIVSDVIGNHDVIKDGKNGYVAKTLVDYTVVLQGLDARTYRRLATAAGRDVRRHYDMKKVARQYRKLYRKTPRLVARKAGRKAYA